MGEKENKSGSGKMGRGSSSSAKTIRPGTENIR